MKTTMLVVAALLMTSFAAPAFAQSKAECEKQGMKWDEKDKKCVKK
jgi:hypothetical protein